MPAFISPLDGNYISLKRAALLIAQEQPGIVPDNIMELFKYALFAREFERPETAIPGIERDHDWNFSLLRIEAPRPSCTVHHLPLEQWPQEYFAVKSATIAEILHERDALPGKAGDWVVLAGPLHNMEVVNRVLYDLARIPYTAFPAKAHDILGDVLLAKAKLRLWMVWKSYDLPNFLKDVASPAQKPSAIVLPEPQIEEADAVRGRPCKAGWPRVKQLVREIRTVSPESSKYMLAFDALKKAAKEFDEKDLPSLETVLKQMKNILATEG